MSRSNSISDWNNTLFRDLTRITVLRARATARYDVATCIVFYLSRAKELIKHANIVILNEEAGLRSRVVIGVVPIESRYERRNEIAKITFPLA